MKITKKWRNTVRQTERIIMKELYEQLGISSQVYDFCHEKEESLKEKDLRNLTKPQNITR